MKNIVTNRNHQAKVQFDRAILICINKLSEVFVANLRNNPYDGKASLKGRHPICINHEV